jgi:hypothetical protein
MRFPHERAVADQCTGNLSGRILAKEGIAIKYVRGASFYGTTLHVRTGLSHPDEIDQVCYKALGLTRSPELLSRLAVASARNGPWGAEKSSTHLTQDRDCVWTWTVRRSSPRSFDPVGAGRNGDTSHAREFFWQIIREKR